MLSIRQILVTALAGALPLLAGCGQKGPLVVPTPPPGAERPTLPEVLRSSVTGSPATAAPATAAPATSAPAAGKP